VAFVVEHPARVGVIGWELELGSANSQTSKRFPKYLIFMLPSRQARKETPNALGWHIFALIPSSRRKSMAVGDRSGHPVRRAPGVVYIWPRFRIEF